MPEATPDDHALAARLATDAGRLLVELRGKLSAEGISGKPLGREGDARAHEQLVARLAEVRPDDAVLSEEGRADPARLTAERAMAEATDSLLMDVPESAF